MDEQIKIAEERREARNLRDRLARQVLQLHPDIKEDPDGFPIDLDWIPVGTTEAAIRSLARHYAKQKLIRRILNERKEAQGDV
ncbi:hypothetical protein LCGC14_0381460 [marine sediment metagenome]|uniref:Uncharacterized protein n=1 Tax=marine sediment metagenome TaxID=412755 RepID=A0A0F9T811_9ZZZZ